ncbi:MAG: polysaccharide deacetylase family protein [Deltaproteobacteria bacterium]|nr:polysaccharide deacetylase family protein [Deltaproteobacteria bacterium]
MIKIIQTWDDGVCDDLRLIDILRRHEAKATFCLNPGLYQNERSFGWMYEGREVRRLSVQELRHVYEGFEICSHSMTHPRLTDVSPDQLQWEVTKSRKILENIFQKPVLGFCYPFNDFNDVVKNAVRSAGYTWARGSDYQDPISPPPDPLAFSPLCRFDDDDIMGKYDRAKQRGTGVFFFWGHSYQLTDEFMWERLESLIKHISFDPDVQWSFVSDLFI